MERMSTEEALRRACESLENISRMERELFYTRVAESKAIEARRRKAMRVVKCEDRTQPETFNLRELNKHLIH